MISFLNKVWFLNNKEGIKMDIKIVTEKTNKLEFEIDENVGFLNALKKELLNDSNIKVATYFIKHPLVGKPKFIVEGDNPRKALSGAIQRLKKLNGKFLEDIKKEIK
jgi:DNA-directed RNA polymerase subunit L